ncbi:extracellular matrix-binding protein EbhA isoform X2 [Eurosta solidaginis]|uniref:extracellular matrix-binding protein EbhA isoform X2 n=1 Tax=Eurosta solidaginis TaxID=178769 RepID=UPI003531390C
MSADPFSLSELSEFLDDSDGHRLAQFIQKKSGKVWPSRKRIFNSEPERFSLEVRLKRVSTPCVSLKESGENTDRENDSQRAQPIVQPNEIQEKPVNTPECSAEKQTHSILKPVNSEADGVPHDPVLQANEIKEEAVDLPDGSTKGLTHSQLGRENPQAVCDPNTRNNTSLPVRDQINNTEVVEPASQTATSQTPPRIMVWLAAENQAQPTLREEEQMQQPNLPQQDEELNRCVSPVPLALLPATPQSLRHKSPRSPMSKNMRSGGVSSADRLRRHVLKRHSVLPHTGKRTLLKEFEKTVTSTDFPPICSTPLSHRPIEKVQNNSPTADEYARADVQRLSISSLSKHDEALMKNMIGDALEEAMKKLQKIDNTERMQISKTPDNTINQPRNIKNLRRKTKTTPVSIRNETVIPDTQDLLHKAQAQSSSNGQAETSHVLITQELLQEVQNTLKDIRKTQAQPSKIVIPVNQTFNSASTATKAQSNMKESVQNGTNIENILHGTIAQKNSLNKLNETLRQSRASSICSDIQSIVEIRNASKCENSHAFLNHPTFTHNNTINARTPIDNDRALTKHNSCHSFANNTANNNDVRETFQGGHIQHACLQHSIVQDPTVAKQIQHECFSPQHSMVQGSAVSVQAKVPEDINARKNRQQSFSRHNSINSADVVKTFNREHAQYECRTDDCSVVQDPTEQVEANVSKAFISGINHEEKSNTKGNNRYVTKAPDTCMEYTQIECCTGCARQPEVQIPRVDTGSRDNLARHTSIHANPLSKTFGQCHNPDHSVIQDTAKAPCSSRKSIGFIDNPTVSSASIVNNQSLTKAASERPRRSILKNKTMSHVKYTKNATINENMEIASSSLITEDEDVDESHRPIAKRRVTRKSGPLNLATERRKPVTRSRRKCKGTLLLSNAVESPTITSDTDAESGLPPAHPLNLHHDRRGEYMSQKQSKRPLNKAPNTPKNGEQFAEELKAHLARLTNLEILDLRKRNSISEALVAPTSLQKSVTKVDSTLKHKLQIEEQIQLEILRRELLGEAEGLHEILAQNPESYNVESVAPNVSDTGILEELVELPSAPDVFKDNNGMATSQQEQMLANLTSSMRTYNSSLIDDNTERVTFIQPNNSVQTRRSLSRKKKSKDLPEITKKYMDIQKRVKKRKQINVSKRSLYSKGDSTGENDENEGNASSEKDNFSQTTATIQPIPPPPDFTPTRPLSNLHIPSPPPPLIATSSRKSGDPLPVQSPTSAGKNSSKRFQFISPTLSREESLPPPPSQFSSTTPNRETPLPPPSPTSPLGVYVLPPGPFLDHCNNTSPKSVNATRRPSIKPSSSTQAACCQTDDELFKKPIMPAPRGRPRKRKASERTEASNRQVESSDTESAVGDEGVRRSKRGLVPRKESFLCGTPNGPPLFYSLMAAAEQRSAKARLKRLEKTRISASLNNNISVPIASSTVKKVAKKKICRPSKKSTVSEEHGHSFSSLGETNTASGTVCSASTNYNAVISKLHPIEENAKESEDIAFMTEKAGVVNVAQPSRESEAPAAISPQNMAVNNNESDTQITKKKKKQKRKLSKATAKGKCKDMTHKELNEMFDQLKNGDSDAPEGSTQKGTKEAKHDEATCSGSKAKVGRKNKTRVRNAKSKKYITDISSAPGTVSKNQSQMALISNQSGVTTQAEAINEAAIGSKSKPKADEKNKKQSSQIKTTEAQLPTQQNTSSNANTTSATNRAGILERSRCNGPPPPARSKLNEMFDQLKNAANYKPPCDESSSSSTSSTTQTRNLRVRLRRTPLRNVGTSRPAELDPSTSSTSSTRTQNAAQKELYKWLRNVSYSAETTNTPDMCIFREMRTSSAGNLYFTDLQGVDYAFYDTDDTASLGYLRFQPLQYKSSKRAKHNNLHFVVLAGTFRFGTENENGIFGIGDMVAINIGQRYNITNMEKDIGILMVIKK